MQEPNSKLRPVNQILGAQPNLGPFPASQIVPWGLILVFCWFCKALFNLSWIWTGLLAAWLMATCWILFGDKAWRYLSKFVEVPYVVRGYALYQSLLEPSDEKKNLQ
jgi:hypothetical protein